MFNDNPTQNGASLAERFQRLSQMMAEVPMPFMARNADLPNVWDITNNVCDRHEILLMC